MSELKKVLTELVDVFEGLILVENEKLDAASNFKVVGLEECMKKEQAAILRIKGLDQRREALQAENGCSGKSFREAMKVIGAEQAAELEPVFSKLEDKIRMFKSVNEDTNTVIRTNLHTVESAAAVNGIHSGYVERTEEIRHFTNRKA